MPKTPAWKYVLAVLDDEHWRTFKTIRREVRVTADLGESTIRGALSHLALCGWVTRGGRPRSAAWKLTARGKTAKGKHADA